jgi:hypothetical protein
MHYIKPMVFAVSAAASIRRIELYQVEVDIPGQDYCLQFPAVQIAELFQILALEGWSPKAIAQWLDTECQL